MWILFEATVQIFIYILRLYLELMGMYLHVSLQDLIFPYFTFRALCGGSYSESNDSTTFWSIFKFPFVMLVTKGVQWILHNLWNLRNALQTKMNVTYL